MEEKVKLILYSFSLLLFSPPKAARGFSWLKACSHRSLGQRPRNPNAVNVFWPKAIFTLTLMQRLRRNRCLNPSRSSTPI